MNLPKTLTHCCVFSLFPFLSLSFFSPAARTSNSGDVPLRPLNFVRLAISPCFAAVLPSAHPPPTEGRTALRRAVVLQSPRSAFSFDPIADKLLISRRLVSLVTCTVPPPGWFHHQSSDVEFNRPLACAISPPPNLHTIEPSALARLYGGYIVLCCVCSDRGSAASPSLDPLALFLLWPCYQRPGLLAAQLFSPFLLLGS